MIEPLVCIDGRLVHQSCAALPLTDAGFVWGATVTDRVRTYNRQPYLLDEHLARFRRSCDLCRVPQPISDDRIAHLANRLLAQNTALADADLSLVMLATPGSLGGPPTLILHTLPLTKEPYRRIIAHGARLVVPATRHVPVASLPPAAKMRSRMVWWIAEQEARDLDPEASALLLDERGFVTETAAANLAIVHDGVVATPPNGTVLPGVSLAMVRRLGGELGVPFEERPLTPDDVRSADEVLLTSTPYGVAGVSTFEGRPVPFPGPLLGRLREAWSERLGCDVWQPFAAGR